MPINVGFERSRIQRPGWPDSCFSAPPSCGRHLRGGHSGEQPPLLIRPNGKRRTGNRSARAAHTSITSPKSRGLRLRSNQLKAINNAPQQRNRHFLNEKYATTHLCRVHLRIRQSPRLSETLDLYGKRGTSELHERDFVMIGRASCT
jgi:hypothetical protein